MGHPPRFVTVGRVRVRAPPPLGTHRGGGGVSPLRVGCRPPPPRVGSLCGCPPPLPLGLGWGGDGGKGTRVEGKPRGGGGRGVGAGCPGGGISLLPVVFPVPVPVPVRLPVPAAQSSCPPTGCNMCGGAGAGGGDGDGGGGTGGGPGPFPRPPWRAEATRVPRPRDPPGRLCPSVFLEGGHVWVLCVLRGGQTPKLGRGAPGSPHTPPHGEVGRWLFVTESCDISDGDTSGGDSQPPTPSSPPKKKTGTPPPPPVLWVPTSASPRTKNTGVGRGGLGCRIGPQIPTRGWCQILHPTFGKRFGGVTSRVPSPPTPMLMLRQTDFRAWKSFQDFPRLGRGPARNWGGGRGTDQGERGGWEGEHPPKY